MPDCRNCECCWDEDYDICADDTGHCQTLYDGCPCTTADDEEA
jgi:hypothetical protein